MTDHLTIDSLSKKSGVSPRAVRYYVQTGIIDPPDGKGRGARYGARHLDQIRKAQDLKARGFTIEQISSQRKKENAPPLLRTAPPHLPLAPLPASMAPSHIPLGPGLPNDGILLRVTPDITAHLTGAAAATAASADIPTLEKALRKTFSRFGF